jgi:DNA uptake protein ComE-like DNA-binding protein
VNPAATTDRTSSSAATAVAPSPDRVQDVYRTGAILLGLAMIPAVWAMAAARFDRREFLPAQTRVDPNVAPWWELAALPEIGESTARAIEAFRVEARSRGAKEPVFARPSDLDLVHGIGPKTLSRIAPYLRFDSEAAPEFTE